MTMPYTTIPHATSRNSQIEITICGYLQFLLLGPARFPLKRNVLDLKTKIYSHLDGSFVHVVVKLETAFAAP